MDEKQLQVLRALGELPRLQCVRPTLYETDLLDLWVQLVLRLPTFPFYRARGRWEVQSDHVGQVGGAIRPHHDRGYNAMSFLTVNTRRTIRGTCVHSERRGVGGVHLYRARHGAGEPRPPF